MMTKTSTTETRAHGAVRLAKLHPILRTSVPPW